jgi:hypothetical protein
MDDLFRLPSAVRRDPDVDAGFAAPNNPLRMRRVKLRWGPPVDHVALTALIAAAYRDIQRRLHDS